MLTALCGGDADRWEEAGAEAPRGAAFRLAPRNGIVVVIDDSELLAKPR